MQEVGNRGCPPPHNHYTEHLIIAGPAVPELSKNHCLGIVCILSAVNSWGRDIIPFLSKLNRRTLGFECCWLFHQCKSGVAQCFLETSALGFKRFQEDLSFHTIIFPGVAEEEKTLEENGNQPCPAHPPGLKAQEANKVQFGFFSSLTI